MRKEWYNVNVPSIFGTQVPTLTPANKSAGQKIAADSLKGRVFEISLADLNKDATNDAYRKMKV
jgi:small subunit ribosomal protein S3Ae